jgi:hypothetical protein
MNIFVLDENPVIAARMHCDKHVPKMIIEHTQMLASAYYSTIGISRKKEIADRQLEVSKLFKGWPRKKDDGSDWPYSITHVNHPCTIWTRASKENFDWLIDCTYELCIEFEKRWSNREHSVKRIIEWMKLNPPNLQSTGQTPFALALPDCYKSESATDSYKKYYAYKTHYMKVVWRKPSSPRPEWFTDEFVTECISSFVPTPVPEKKPRLRKAA